MRAGGLEAAVAHARDEDHFFAEDQPAATAAAAARALAVPLGRRARGSDEIDERAGAPAPPFSACIPWSMLAREPPRDCGAVIRAVVQHNHACSERAQATTPQTPGPPSLLVVGYAMREARERALAEAGLLYFAPRGGVSGTGEGDRAVVFMPLDCDGVDNEDEDEEGGENGGGDDSEGGGIFAEDHPLVLPIVDVFLHKASDYLRLGEKGGYVVSSRLQRHADGAGAAGAAVVDPLEAVARCVFDRRDIAALLGAAFPRSQQGQEPHGSPPPLPVDVRGPTQAAFAERPASPGAMAAALAAAGLHGPPYIVKTAAACGVPQAHRMAIALSDRGLWEALGGGGGGGGGGGDDETTTVGQALEQPTVPFPVVVDEFVDHGGVLHKVYVVGDELVYAAPPRPSIPDLSAAVQALRVAEGARYSGGGREPAAPCAAAAAAGGAAAAVPPDFFTFDALKSLPTLLPWLPAESQDAASAVPPLDPAALQAVARRLREASSSCSPLCLARSGGGGGDKDQAEGGLSLFGFDVVVAKSTHKTDKQQWVVVDVNYLPNYRGGGERAAAALRAVLCRSSAEAKGRRRRRGTS